VAAISGLPMERCSWVDLYAYRSSLIAAQDMAAIYSASDVLLSASRGEGFGIPVIEAQACGTPVIVSNFSAQPELVGAGWTVGGQLDIDPMLHGTYLTPSVGEIVMALEAAYEARGDASLRDKAIEKAQEYDHTKVYPEMWRPYITRLEKQLTEEEAPTAPPARNRRERRLAKKARRAA
jgi:glycosyltransferase involved in cell wall biosynthesis